MELPDELSSLYNPVVWDQKTAKEKIRSFVQRMNYEPTQETVITCYTESASRSRTYRNRWHRYTAGIRPHLINLGYTEDGIIWVAVTLSKKGIYTFDSMEVISNPMSYYEEAYSGVRTGYAAKY